MIVARWSAAAVLALGVVACASPSTQVGQKEDLLAAAGFQCGRPICRTGSTR